MKISLWTKAQNTLARVLGTLLFTLASWSAAHASHLAAADISAKYIGSAPGQCIPFLTYEVTLDIFGACEKNSAFVSPNQTIYVSSPSGCYTGSIPISVNVLQRDTLDQLCNDAKSKNSCAYIGKNPYPTDLLPGFVRHRFVATVSLPYACSDWTFSWSQNARNAGIKNLNLGTDSGANLYISCMINNVAEPTISTPKFTVTPTPFLCQGKPSTFLNGPIPQDTITSTLEVVPAPAKNSANITIPYIPPYSAANPVGSPTGYTVNRQTGTTSFTAPNTGAFVLTFRLNRYIGGTLVSYTERDVQVAVLPCIGDVPTVTDPPRGITGGYLVQSGSAGNIITVCPGSTLRFNILGRSNSPQAMLTIDDTLGSRIGKLSLTSYPNTTGGTDSVRGDFTYTPKAGDEGDYTKIFTVSDTSCGRSGQVIIQKSYVSVLIRVPRGIDAGPDGYYCPAGGAPYQINVTSPAPTTYTWSVLPGGDKLSTLSCINCPDPKATPKITTDYVVTAAFSPLICKLKDTIQVVVNRIQTVPDDELVVCRPGLVQLDAKVTGKKEIQDIRCGQTAEFAKCDTPAEATIGYCIETTGGALKQTPFHGSNASVRTQMILSSQELVNGGLKTGTLRSVSLFISDTGAQTQMANFKISMACSPKFSYASSNEFIKNLAVVFSRDTLRNLSLGWNTFTLDKPYNWDKSQSLVVDFCFNNDGVKVGSTDADVRYSATTGYSVLQRISDTDNVCSLADSPGVISKNRPNIRFGYCLPQEKDFKVYWRPGTYLRDSNVANPVAYVPKSYQLYAEVLGYQGCVSRDTLDILLAHDTLYTTPKDSLICPGDVAILNASPADYYKWYQDNYQPATTLDCDTCPRVIAAPIKNTDYFVVGYNYWGKNKTVCADTVMATVRIKNTSHVRLTPKETTIKYGEAVALYADSANVYHWSPGTGLNTTVGATVMASPKTTTKYIVTGIGLDGCQTSDSGTVTVDPRTLVVVPNAFTPNGDNQNDYFKPNNLTTRRVIEFRVFNRWGQQVFNASGDTPGWDGTWNGEPQDAGTYSYLIRTTSPDGQSETFKGDVVLIR